MGFPGGPPSGFGAGTTLPEGVTVLRAFESGLWGGGNGDFMARVNGTAQVSGIPGIGKPPEGKVWIVVDTQLWLLAPDTPPAEFNTEFRYQLGNLKEGVALDPDVAAYAAPESWVAPGANSEIWLTVHSAAGRPEMKKKDHPWNSMTRGTVIKLGPTTDN